MFKIVGNFEPDLSSILKEKNTSTPKRAQGIGIESLHFKSASGPTSPSRPSSKSSASAPDLRGVLV